MGARSIFVDLERKRCPVGDKSPKSKERAKKQDVADKNTKKAAAKAKAAPPAPAKKGA